MLTKPDTCNFLQVYDGQTSPSSQRMLLGAAATKILHRNPFQITNLDLSNSPCGPNTKLSHCYGLQSTRVCLHLYPVFWKGEAMVDVRFSSYAQEHHPLLVWIFCYLLLIVLCKQQER